MAGILGHDAALYGYTGPRTTWANEMNLFMNHAPDAGSFARPVDLQTTVLWMPPVFLLSTILIYCYVIFAYTILHEVCI